MKFHQYFGAVISVLLLLGLSSCEDNMTPDNEVEYLEAGFMGMCFWGFYDKGYEEVVLTDMGSYLAFGDSVRVYIDNLDCSAATLPDIDFNKYFLVGKFTSGGGCSVEYDRQVTADEENNKLIYKIDADYTGLCSMLIVDMNWVLIPKKYCNYTIEFQVE